MQSAVANEEVVVIVFAAHVVIVDGSRSGEKLGVKKDAAFTRNLNGGKLDKNEVIAAPWSSIFMKEIAKM